MSDLSKYKGTILPELSKKVSNFTVGSTLDAFGIVIVIEKNIAYIQSLNSDQKDEVLSELIGLFMTMIKKSYTNMVKFKNKEDVTYIDSYIRKLERYEFGGLLKSDQLMQENSNLLRALLFLKNKLQSDVVIKTPPRPFPPHIISVPKEPNCFPTNKDITLREHQLLVIQQMLTHRGLLAVHSLGSGKTLIAITAAHCLIESFKREGKKCKIICVSPKSVVDNFKKELIKAYDNANFENYEFHTFESFFNKHKQNSGWCDKNTFLIIDEAHRLKAHVEIKKGIEQKITKGKRSDAVLYCAQRAHKVLLLTGTPVVNDPTDIINLIAIVDGKEPVTKKEFGNILSDQKKFEAYFKCKVSYYSRKDDGDFPDTLIERIPIKMTPEYYEQYRRVEKQELEEHQVDIFKGKKLQAFYNGIRRAANAEIDDPSKNITAPNPKLQWVEKYLKNNKRIKTIIFSQFDEMGVKQIEKICKKLNVKYDIITGKTQNRDEIIQKYNNNEIDVMLISRAGGEGLNYLQTRSVIIMQPGWNPAEIEQAIGRAVRFKSHHTLTPSKRNVIVYKLILEKPSNAQDKLDSIDVYLENTTNKKFEKNTEFMNRLKEVSIERDHSCLESIKSKEIIINDDEELIIEEDDDIRKKKRLDKDELYGNEEIRSKKVKTNVDDEYLGLEDMDMDSDEIGHEDEEVVVVDDGDVDDGDAIEIEDEVDEVVVVDDVDDDVDVDDVDGDIEYVDEEEESEVVDLGVKNIKMREVCLNGYQLLDLLGKPGTYGLVKQACLDGDCNYALKIQNISKSNDKKVFDSECQYSEILSRKYGIGPKFIARWECNNFGTQYGFIVTEKWDKTLYEILTSKSTKQICEAKFIQKLYEQVQNIHKEGLIHSDILPKNILVKLNSKQEIADVTLADFGLMRPLQSWLQYPIAKENDLTLDVETMYKYFTNPESGAPANKYFIDRQVTLEMVQQNPKHLDIALIWVLQKYCS